MPTIKRFEELRIWQDARKQCQQIGVLVQSSGLKNDFALRDQINRSSGSVMDNIAEGFDRFTKNDFRHFLIIARGSNAEVRSQLYRVLDKGYCTVNEIEELIRFSEMLSIKITNFIHYIDKSGYKNKPVNTHDVSEPSDTTYGKNELLVSEELNEELISFFQQPPTLPTISNSLNNNE
ncbi:MAG TPA: four helix bundle protein [Flavipsychrobacter sp.]|nr:four helix bundle protein [Flavipsychrobacter sp.]